MARKENQMMMNNNIQVTLSMSQFEEQLLQLKEKIESQSFPCHQIVTAFEQLRTSAKNIFAHRQHNLHSSTINNNINNVYEIDQHLLKLFQDLQLQVATIQQNQQQIHEISNSGAAPSIVAQKQVITNSANKYSFQNSFWEGDKISFDSGSTLSYFHDEGKNETCDENQCQVYDDDDQSSDNYHQRLNSSGNSYTIQNNQLNSQNNTYQSSLFQNQFFQSNIQPVQQSQKGIRENDSYVEKKYNIHESIINTNLLAPFTQLPSDINSNQVQNNPASKDRVVNNSFQGQSADEFEEENQTQMNITQPQNVKSNSQNTLKGMMTSNNIGTSSITNVRKGKKANLMHNIKNQLKKTCNFDTNDDEDEEEEEYEEFNYFNNNNVNDNDKLVKNRKGLSHEKSEFKLEEEEIQKDQKFMKKPNQISFYQQTNLFQSNQIDSRLFDQHNQKSFPIGRDFDAELQEEGDSDDLDNIQIFSQVEYKQNTQKSSQITQNNTPQANQLIQQQQLKQQLNQNINFEEEEDDNEDDEEFDDGCDDEDETYNANLDVVGLRESFQEGERLSFMASQRIHYYKMDDFSEILNERSHSFEQHCENMRNIIMTMSNNYGGLIMFGLGKNKSVQGINLNTKEKQEFIKFITNIKNSIHNSKQLFCKVSYFPIYRLNSQSHTAQTNCVLGQQKDNTQSPFNYKNIKPEAPTFNTTSHFKLFDQAPPADFSLFSDNPNPSQNNNAYPPLLLFDSDSQTEQDLLFTPFCSQVDPKKKIFQTNNGANTYFLGGSDTSKICNTIESNWQGQQSSNWTLETSQSSNRKGSGDTKQWIPDRYIIRIFVDQGQKLDSTYVYIKNKEITSAIYDKKLKIFKQIYGEPLLNKILSKAQNPSYQAQKLNLAEPDKEGLAVSSPFPQQLIHQIQQQPIQPPFILPQEKQFNLQNLNTFIGSNIPLQNQIQQGQNIMPIGSLNPSIAINNSKIDKNALQQENEEITSLLGEALKNEDYPKECVGSASPPLTQEYIKHKRGQKIINDTKKRQIKEKNQRYLLGEEKIQTRKSQQSLSNSSKSNSRESCTTLSDEFKVVPITKYYLIEFIGFEHSDNAKSFRAQIEKQIGPCLVECGIAKYDSLFFKVNESLQIPPNIKETHDNVLNKKLNQNIYNNNNNSFMNIGNFNNNCVGSNNNSVTGCYFNTSNSNLSFVEKQYEWMEKLYNYLIMGDNWKCLISKDRIFKKLIIDGSEYYTDESNQWLCFQNVKNKNNFTSQIAQLQQKNVIERVNLYHQHVFKVNKSKEFEKFCATNKLFQQCFLSDVIKKGYSTSNIIVKSLKNTHRAQESFKQLLNNFKFTITSQGSNFFVCLFQSPLESFLAMERLINHRKQKFILDLFTSNALDAVIELQDNLNLYQQQQQQIHQQ